MGAAVTFAGSSDASWTDKLVTVAGGADLLIAENYYDKAVPYHLRYADL